MPEDTATTTAPPQVSEENKRSRRKLYDLVSSRFNLGSFGEFDKKMNVPESRKKLHALVSEKFDLGDLNTFETKVGRVTSVPEEVEGKANTLFMEPGGEPITTTAKAPTLAEQASVMPQAPSVEDKAAFQEQYGHVDPREISGLYGFMPFTAPFVGIERGARTLEEAASEPGAFTREPMTGLPIPSTPKTLAKTAKGLTEIATSAAGFVPIVGATSALLQGAQLIPGSEYLFQPVTSITKPTTEEGKAWAEVADNVVQLAAAAGITAGVQGVRGGARGRFATEIKEAVSPADMRNMFARVKYGVGTPQEVELTKIVAKIYEAGPEGQPISGVEQVKGKTYHPSTPKWIRKILGEFPPGKDYPKFRFTPKPEEVAATPEGAPTAELSKGLPPADETGAPAKPRTTRGERRAGVVEGMTAKDFSDADFSQMREDLLAAGYDGNKIARLKNEELVQAYQGDQATIGKISGQKPPSAVVEKFHKASLDQNAGTFQKYERGRELSTNEFFNRGSDATYEQAKQALDNVGTRTTMLNSETEALAQMTPEERTTFFYSTEGEARRQQGLMQQLDREFVEGYIAKQFNKSHVVLSHLSPKELYQLLDEAREQGISNPRESGEAPVTKASDEPGIEEVRQAIRDGKSDEQVAAEFKLPQGYIDTIRKGIRGEGTMDLAQGATNVAPTSLHVQIGEQQYEVPTIKDASAKWIELRDQLKLAPGQMGPVSVVDDKGNVIGHVDYHGKVYEGSLDKHTGQTKVLHDPPPRGFARQYIVEDENGKRTEGFNTEEEAQAFADQNGGTVDAEEYHEPSDDHPSVTSAFDLGRKAYKAGLTAAPALDPEFMKLLANKPDDIDSMSLLKAWSDGWNKTNISTPVPGEIEIQGTPALPPPEMTGSTVTVERTDEKGHPTRITSTKGQAIYVSDQNWWQVNRTDVDFSRAVISEVSARMLLGESREVAEKVAAKTDRPDLNDLDAKYMIVEPNRFHYWDMGGFHHDVGAQAVTIPGFEDLDLFVRKTIFDKTYEIVEGMTGIHVAGDKVSPQNAAIAADQVLRKNVATNPISYNKLRDTNVDNHGVSPRYKLRKPGTGTLTPTPETPIFPTGEEITYGDPITGTTSTSPGGSPVAATPRLDEGERAGTPSGTIPQEPTAGVSGREGTTGRGRAGETPGLPEGPATGIRGRTGSPQERKGGGGRPGTPAPAGERPIGNQPVGAGPDQSPEQLTPTTEADYNHVILPEHVIVPTGEVGKIKANIHALKLLDTLEKENRNPTPGEKEILARYVGWGGIPNVFNEAQADLRDPVRRERRSPDQISSYENWEAKYGKYYDELKKLLTDAQFESAASSTINAHYTSRDVIQHGLWAIVKRLGFRGGRAIEPAGGIGHIIGLTPEDLRTRTRWTAVELDNITGRLLSKLYPQAKVHITGFQTAPIPNNTYSLAVTNVPFGKTGPHDERYPSFSLHNYFIARDLDALKPGGIQVVITSISTLDNEASRKARQWISEKADFIGAIRLPNTAFKENAGTEVTTDILVFRKKDGNPLPVAETFLETRPITTKDNKTYHLNEYFVRNPSMMLGEMSYTGKMYREGEITLEPFPEKPAPGEKAKFAPSTKSFTDFVKAKGLNYEETAKDKQKIDALWDEYNSEQAQIKEEKMSHGDFRTQLQRAVGNLPENLASLVADEINENNNIIESGVGTKEAAFVLEKGEVYQSIGNVLTKVEASPKDLDMVKSFISVRDVLKDLLTKQIDPTATDTQIETARAALNKVYDAHVGKHREFLRSSGTLLSEDPEFPLVASLEDLIVTQKQTRVTSGPQKGQMRDVNVREYRKAMVFTQRTMYPRQEPTTASTIDDAVSVSLNYRNRVDPDYMSKLLSTTADDVKAKLLESGKVFENPETGLLETPDEYLSGNVRKKLRAAELASVTNADYERNADALRPLIPTDILFNEIGFRLGSSWMPKEIVESFLSETLGVDADVHYIPILNKWKVVATSGYQGSTNTDTYGVTDERGRQRYSGHDLVEDALNMVQTVAYDDFVNPDGSKSRVKNPEATLAAQAMQEKLQAEFQTFVRGSDSTDELQRIYNDKYNSYVERKYRGASWEYYPGASTVKKLRPHQKAVVARNLSHSNGVWHSVGTGKTLIAITTAMEAKRLGLSRKTVYIAHNSNPTDVATEARLTYPLARILAPAENERSADQRQRLLSRIATSDWDFIVLPQSFAELIPDDADRVREVIAGELRELKEARIRAAQEEGKDAPSVKALIRAEKALEKQLEKQAGRRTDNVLTWDQLGVDMVIVDEAHAYKKLGFQTSLANIKGIDTGRSDRAFSMWMKTRSVQEKNHGKNVIFMTGTPITNTMAEIWTMLRFTRPDLLKEYGIEKFDAFAATFGNIVPGFEYTSTAQWKVVSRFAKFQNGPELIKLIRTAGDVVLAEDVKLPGVPMVKGGKPEEVKIARSKELEHFIGRLRQTLKEWEKLPGREKRKLTHIPLLIYNQAKQAAIDLRLINPTYPDDPDGKVNMAVKRIAGLYQQYNDQKATQLVFADLFQSPPQEEKYLDEDKKIPNPAYGKGERFNLYEDIKQKLIRAGIPKEEIFIMREAGKGPQRDRVKASVNNGTIRVLLGSTLNIGTALNVHQRLVALHHLDAPPRPMDLEQRNGRIIRQGNMFPEVNILIYGVEQTLDATAFQRLVIKQKFINQVMRGNLSSRTFEDPADDVQMSLQEIMADLTGDPLALQRHAEDTKIRQLEMLKNAHQDKLRKVNHEIQELRKFTIPNLQEKLARTTQIQKDFAVEFPEGKINEVTIAGQVYSGKTVGDALATYFTAAFKMAKDEYLKHAGEVKLSTKEARDIQPIRIGKYVLQSHVETNIVPEYKIDTQRASWSLTTTETAKANQAMVRGNFESPNGFTRSFSSSVAGLPDDIRDFEAQIERNKKAIVEKEEYLGTPFAQEAELELHKKRLGEIEQELQAKTQDDTPDEPDVDTVIRPSLSPGGGGGGGVTSVTRAKGALTPRLRDFVSTEAVPDTRSALEPFVRAKDWILGVLAPTALGPEAKQAGQMLRSQLGDLARKKEVVFELLKKARKHFQRMGREHSLLFVDAVETGQQLVDPLENEAASTLRRLLEGRWNIIQARKNIEAYIENYFPHIWKNPQKAASVYAKYMGRRPLEGTKEYLKRRKIPTTKEGIELGLEPVSDNPIDLVIARVYDMDRYLMSLDLRDDLDEHGLWKFYPIGAVVPEGLSKLDDKFGTVFGNPNIPVSEYVDAAKYDKLVEIMQNFGVPFTRKMRIGGKKLGYYQEPVGAAGRGGQIVTRSATPLGVIIHELGHFLDSKYGLGDKFVNHPAMKKELRALADLRYEGQDVTEHFKSYVREKEEKMANMIDAFVNIPDKFKKIAPNTWAHLNRLIDRTPELQPLREITSGLAYKEIETSVSAGGAVIHGNYWLPDGAAQVINNYLSPGLRGNVFFDSWRGIGNTMNMVQLGFSAFHLFFTSLDAASSDVALSIQMATEKGMRLQSVAKFVQFPIAPVTTYLKGNKLYRDYLRENPENIKMVEAIVNAGGRVRMDRFYYNSAVEKFWDALRAGKYANATWQLPWGIIEASAWPVLGHIVPRMKLGVFVDMARFVFEKAENDGWTKEQTIAALQEAWDAVDDRMGQLVYDNLFWRRTAKDLALSTVRSVGWNVGTWRAAVGGVADVIGQTSSGVRGKGFRMTPRMGYLIAMPFVAGLLGSILYYLYNGRGPKDLKDYYFPKTGRKNANGTDQRVSFPSYMKDVYAYKEEPITTIENKIHPLASMVAQMLHNHDYYGTEIRNPDDLFVKQAQQAASYVAKSFVPFSARGATQLRSTGASTQEQLQSFVGINPAPRYIDDEPWEKKMYDKLQRRGVNFRTPEKAEVSQARREFVGKMHSGRLTPSDLEKAMKMGLIADSLSGMDEQLMDMIIHSPEEIAFKRLTVEEAIEVFKEMPLATQKQYQPLLAEKISNIKDPSALLPKGVQR